MNADVESAVNASPQRMPAGYNGTWYYKDDYAIETMPALKESEIKLTVVDNMTPKMLNIRGINQTAGDGTFEYLRYKYYDGRQIPVMMIAGGAGVWFYGNGYNSRTIATQLDGLKYGDETKTQMRIQNNWLSNPNSSKFGLFLLKWLWLVNPSASRDKVSYNETNLII